MNIQLKNWKEKVKNMEYNHEILKELELNMDATHPEKGKIPIKMLGYGEISFVFEILEPSCKNIAFKRLPLFSTEGQVKRHIDAYNRYNQILNDEIGIKIPPQDTAWFWMDEKKKKKISLYCMQEKLNPDSIGNKLIHTLPDPDVKKLFVQILKEFKKVWDFNRNNEEIKVGLDGQISNWSLINYDPGNPKIDDNSQYKYIDTSTPMYRINGEEAMDAVLFLKSAPGFIRWLLKLLFLDEVMDRYYDLRSVIIDLIANFYKEQRSELIPDLVTLSNEFIKKDLVEFELEPLTVEEIAKYYKGDKQIWEIFQGMRKFDKFMKTKIFRMGYDFYLPGKIKR